MIMDKRNCERLELNKILSACAEYACLDGTRSALSSLEPSCDLEEVRSRLKVTHECDLLLFRYGLGRVEYFGDITDILGRASKGSALSCAELLEARALLRSARLAYTSVNSVDDPEITAVKEIAARIYYDKLLEDDITDKILSTDEVSDFASDALHSIRSAIKNLNERIRSKLSEYVTGGDSKYLQDAIVTMRGDRFVIPVKAEHKSKIKGLVHDRSQSGATFFIEPEYVLEMNNELVALQIDEREEVERILKALSARVGAMRERLETDISALTVLDGYYARAEYSYSLNGTYPRVNDRGYIEIIKGRHPLIDKQEVVPVSVELGKDYNFLLISGANTGGKTVTLKMAGLFCLMAACGIFIPAAEGSSVCVFDGIFCDVGDSQSIEESLSTFSSHIKNIRDICDSATEKSLVLIDEPGGGTNPDEGQAIAKAVVEYLLDKGCRGIVTTHFTPLKEFAYSKNGIENASMEFDSATLKPLYRIKIGLPGASNALAIARRMGLNGAVLEKAEGYLSEGGRAFENIVRRAEDSRVEAERKLSEVEALEAEWKSKIKEANAEIDRLNKEREKLRSGARAESRRIINERTASAEEMLGEIEKIFAQEEISQTDLFKARALRNRLKDLSYGEDGAEVSVTTFKDATADNIKEGATVYVKSTGNRGEVLSFNRAKGEVLLSFGGMKMRCKISELQIVSEKPKANENKVRVKIPRKPAAEAPRLEINLIGMTVEEALYELDNFIDRAVTDNLEEIKVIHGVGTGKLREAIGRRLKSHKNVKSYRLGKYGEGETGVTIITLK